MKLAIEAETKDVYLPQEGQEGYETLRDLMGHFEAALLLQAQKGRTYGAAWKRQGWMGNLARMQSKMERLRNMLWRDFPMQDVEESIEDTAMDLLNLTAMFLENYKAGNRFGNDPVQRH